MANEITIQYEFDRTPKYNTSFGEEGVLSREVLNHPILGFDIKCRVHKNSTIKLGENQVTINRRVFYGITLLSIKSPFDFTLIIQTKFEKKTFNILGNVPKNIEIQKKIDDSITIRENDDKTFFE